MVKSPAHSICLRALKDYGSGSSLNASHLNISLFEY